MKKFKVKEAKGITLVALVITVIILLILAGVALSLVIGENGLIAKAKQGVGVYKQSAENETTQLGSFEEEFRNLQKVANVPDISGFNKNNTYYVEWDTTSSPYNINESTKISERAPSDWYDYTEGVNKWANVKTTGGGNDCYWVWIPRYAYKVPNRNSAETIEVKFLEGTTDNPIDKSSITISNNTTEESWNVHPAFWWDKDNDGVKDEGEQLTGIWVAKYEASSSKVDTINLENGTIIDESNSLNGNGGGQDTTKLQVRVKPNVTSWRGININGIFTVCRNLTKSGNSLENSTNLNSHMMKNTEWGAVAYLSSSKYGKTDAEGNRVRVWNNPYYNTTNDSTITGLAGESDIKVNNATTTNLYIYNTSQGCKASTTGNVYGVYDMAGGTWEYTAAILYKGASSDSNRNKLWDASNAKYVDQYKENLGSSSTYYGNIAKYGDAVYETSSSGGSYDGSWDDTYSDFPYPDYPVFRRGGHANIGNTAGVFAFGSYAGGANTSGSFRPVVFSLQ